MPRAASCSWLALALVACVGDRPLPTVAPAPAQVETTGTAPAPGRDVSSPPTFEATERRDEVDREPRLASPVVPPTPTGLDDAQAQLKRAALQHLERDEFAQARAVLDELLTAPAMAQARALLDARRPIEALAAIEDALSSAPGEPRTLLVHGEASLQAGLLLRDPAKLETSLASFLRSGEGAESKFGASRAARALGRYEVAVDLAREGWRALGPSATFARKFGEETPERTLADALWLWFESQPMSTESDYARLGDEVVEANLQLVARESAEPTVWLRVAEVERRLGRLDEEVTVLERALGAAPRSERIAERLADAARVRGGIADLIATVLRVREQRPQNPALWRATAEARFELALSTETSNDAAIQALSSADMEFERWSSLSPEQRDASLRKRAACRAAAGWRQLGAQRVDGAVERFRSVQALAPDAVHWTFESVESAALGLARCAEALRDSNDFAEGARIWSDLHRMSPEVVRWAVEAGRTWRTAAERTLLLSKELKLAADGRIADAATIEDLRRRAQIRSKPNDGLEWTLALQRASKDAEKRAAKWFKASYEALVDAAQLAPNEMRLLCDAAEVAVYELRADLPDVEAFLKEAIRLGETRSRDASLSPSERRAVLEAWGDAHECLGVLSLEYKRDAQRALTNFKRSREIGPDPRPIVTDTYIPRCEEILRSTFH